jgi:hypothetical protein
MNISFILHYFHSILITGDLIMAKKVDKTIFNKKQDDNTTNKPVAYVNYMVPTKSGEYIRSERGFPIYMNEDYPNHIEEQLVEAAKANGGTFKTTLPCTIAIRTDKPKINADQIAGDAE